jgi:prepilin signal peptidase PulO-like enzyme (type II secretory pathway)
MDTDVFGDNPLFVCARLVVFSAFAFPISLIDARELRIPDILSLGAWISLASLDAIGNPQGFAEKAAASALMLAVFAGIRRLTRALGGGDVKYAASIGLLLGLPWCFVSLFVSSLAAIAYGARAAARWRKLPGSGGSSGHRAVRESLGAKIPFAPFLTAGALCAYALELEWG